MIEEVHIFIFVNEELAALDANASKHFVDGVEVLDVEDRASELNMSEETGAFEVVIAIGGAEHICFECTHTRVEEAIEHGGGVVNICIFSLDFDDGVIEDLFRRQYAKLNSYNTGRMLMVEVHFVVMS